MSCCSYLTKSCGTRATVTAVKGCWMFKREASRFLGNPSSVTHYLPKMPNFTGYTVWSNQAYLT